ncbi:ABC transporter ATP-binding protein [Listeria fleischmannii FSL S10-1203]|uniref:ABC transporter ATP-binding protein n=1 Tax=Listeria fleischmannii FSL S10-1203 TaxID=1265822 RepID=W7DQL4_9LIST|nr:ABC transporter ATP-binding protein [Listeria fleischmannii FSL S10-1203]
MFEMSARGTAIIFSSHRMENVEELCDSLLMLKKRENRAAWQYRFSEGKFWS